MAGKPTESCYTPLGKSAGDWNKRQISWRNLTVKKVSDFPVPSRDVANQTLPGGEFF